MQSELLTGRLRLHEAVGMLHIEYCGLINLSFISDISKCIIIFAVNHHISLMCESGHFDSIRTDVSVGENSQSVFGHIYLSRLLS